MSANLPSWGGSLGDLSLQGYLPAQWQQTYIQQLQSFYTHLPVQAATTNNNKKLLLLLKKPQ